MRQMTVSPHPSDRIFPDDGEGGHDAPGVEVRSSGEERDELSLGTADREQAVIEVPDEEEVLVKKAPTSPSAPAQKEIDQHRIAHLPDRSWYADCVEAFGRERAHHQQEDERIARLICCD